MEKFTKFFRNRYLPFIITLIALIIAVLFIVNRSSNLQKHSAHLISKAEKQRTLSQSITKIVLSIDNGLNATSKENAINSLKIATDEFEVSQNYLYTTSKKENTRKIDSLLKISEVYHNKMIASSKNISNDLDSEYFKRNVSSIKEAEAPFMLAMDSIVNEYHVNLENDLQNLKLTIYLLALLAVLLLLGEYLFVITPSLKHLFKRNEELVKTNYDLSISENKLSLSQLALNRMHTELKAIMNSGPIIIVSTDNKGIIKHFNYGAELLLGYSASEMIGKKAPEIFHLEEELDKFRVDIAKLYNQDPEGFDPYLELAKRNAQDTREWTYRRKDGTTFPVQLTLTAIKNDIGEKTGFLGVSFDITEIEKAKDALLKKNQLLNFAEEITMIGHWQWDTVADKVQWSNNLYKMFELDKETINLQFDSYFNFVHPDDKEIVTEYFQKVANNKEFYSFTHRIITTTGKIKTVQLLGEVFTNDKGEVIEMIGTGQDITEHQMAENKFKGLLESAPDAMIILNEKTEIQLINKQAEVLFGYSAQELFEKGIELLIPKQFTGNFETYQEGFFTKPNVKAMGVGKELFGVNKNGQEIPIQISLSPLETENGVLVSLAIRDISFQKQAETELLKKNQLLNFAEEITKIGHWQWDTVADKVEWSNNLYNIFELNRETIDLNFNTYFNYVHPEDKDLVTEYFDNAINGKGFTNFAHRISTNGKTKVIQLLGEVITNDKGEVVEMIGTCQDITEQRMAENKFRSLLESAPDAMVIMNDKGEIQLINKQAELLFGYSTLELLQKSVEILIPKRFTADYEAYRDGFFGKSSVTTMGVGKELFGLNKAGIEIPVQVSLRPLQTDEGILVSAAIRDITENILAADELLKKNKLLNFAEKITMMGNWQWNLITNDVKWSANLFQIFGVDTNTEVKFDTYFSYVHPEDKERVAEHIDKSFVDGKFDDLLHRIVLDNGSTKTIQLLAEIITNNAGELTEMIGTCQDVTQQRMLENKFRGLLESAPDAMVIVNEKGEIQLINKQAEKLFGYTALELLNEPVEILIPKRFMGNHETYRGNFFTTPKVREMGVGKELFGINKKGKEIPIQISLSPLQTEEGLLVSAAIRDISAQKIAERKILEAKENLEVLTQHLTGQNKQLADFAHITSHNLRSPVSNLNALLHLYGIAESEEERKLLFEKFEIVINHLTSTLNTLIEALKTKREGGKSIELLSFNEVLNKTKEIVSGQIINTNAVIISDFSKTPEINYHKTYLESIFLNLVTNAIKYRSPDRDPVIRINTESVNGKIKLTFQDNGLGIDLKRHGHKIFGLNKTFHRHPEAKGVGLYLTKIQIDSMGDTIYVTSEVDKGSIFTVIFNEKKNEKSL